MVPCPPPLIYFIPSPIICKAAQETRSVGNLRQRALFGDGEVVLHGRWWRWHRSNRDFLGGCLGSYTHGYLLSSSTPRRCCCCLPTLLLTYFYAPLFFWSTPPFNVSTYGFSLCLFLIHHWWIHLFIKDLCLIVLMLSLPFNKRLLVHFPFSFSYF